MADLKSTPNDETSAVVLGSSNHAFQITENDRDDSGSSEIDVGDPAVLNSTLIDCKTLPAIPPLPHKRTTRSGDTSAVRGRTRSVILNNNRYRTASEGNTGSGKPYDPQCVCAVYKEDAQSIQCDVCDTDWHLECVSLLGLTPQMVECIVKWICPNCFVSPVPTSNSAMIRATIKSELKDSKRIFAKTLEMEKQIAVLQQKLDDFSTKDPSPSPNSTNIDSLLVSISAKLEAVESRESRILAELGHLKDTMSRNASPTGTTNISQTHEGMEPNTTSPNSRPAQPQCEPYSQFVEQCVSPEVSEALLSMLSENESNFVRIGDCRDTLYFGEFDYRYTGGSHPAKRVPEAIQDLLDEVRNHLPDKRVLINSCLVNKYTGGKDFIPPHSDDEVIIDPASDIVTVSVGASRSMKFTCKTDTESTTKCVELTNGSMLVCSRFSQDFWVHEIEKREPSAPTEAAENEVRYSFTFRHMSPRFAKSTIILGDSNTDYLNFGCEKGTFGPRMPGKSKRILFIEEIPKPEKIGPFRNIVLHVGINNLKSNNRRSTRSLVNELDAKCRAILDIYPKSKIHLSMLLPTKQERLNVRVKEFNDLLLDMSVNEKRMYVIDTGPLLCDSRGLLRDEFGRFRFNRPNAAEPIHLGKKGIRLLGNCIKQAIVGNSTRSQGRFNGEYNRAVDRSSYHGDAERAPQRDHQRSRVGSRSSGGGYVPSGEGYQPNRGGRDSSRGRGRPAWGSSQPQS